MKQVNEKIGYIDKHIFNLDNIVNKIYEFISSDKKKWDKFFEVKGKPNNKDINGFQYKTFIFDLKNDKLGSIKVILVNITDDKVESYKFEDFIDAEATGFYSAVDSTVDKGNKNIGYIYLNYNDFLDYHNDELYDELEEIIYHELRHYYDNVMGVFSGSTKELLHITLIADELNINNKTYKEIQKTSMKSNTTYKDLNKFLYVS